ncbi:putative C2H2-type domain-containing protein [Seiridium cardinale]|uniref:C2H2-type domain-containing protein n=1 Tax=Seiridium cardinale TaxID=138064 RepID=A0ABR2XDV7_9PEZI
MSGSDYPSERLRRWLSQTVADEVLEENEASDPAGLSLSEERKLALPLDTYKKNDSHHAPSPSFFSARGDSLIPEVRPNAEEDFQAKGRALDHHISDQESIPDEGSILQESFLRPSNLYKQCLDGYRSFLLSISGSPEIPQSHGFNKMLEECGRLKLWGDQTRALHPGVLGSLSYVLRDQTEVSETVQTTFQRMIGSLTSAIKAAEKPSVEDLQKLENLDNDSDLDSISKSEDSDLDEQWSLEEPLYISLRNIFDCIELLFQLSNLLRQQRFQDRYLHSSVHPNQPYGTIQDNEHVRLKVQMWRNDQKKEGRIPIIERYSVDLPWESGMEVPVSPEVMSQRKVSEARQESIDSDLFSRIAVANTRRREQFLYWETHPYSGDARARARKNGTDGRSEKSQTIRTFSSIAKSAIYMDAMEPDTRATTYAPSMINDVAQSTIRVPEFALISAGRDTFECPFCHMILDSEPMQYRQNWKRHVFRDLRPYICTYQACATPYRMFATRYDWVYHESQLHRRQWSCQKCSAAFDSKEKFQGHLEQSHAGIWNGPQISILADMGEGPKSEASRSACRFCLRSMPLKRMSNHVADHLEELSLFALPKLDLDENQSLGDHNQSKETEGRDGGEERIVKGRKRVPIPPRKEHELSPAQIPEVEVSSDENVSLGVHSQNEDNKSSSGLSSIADAAFVPVSAFTKARTLGSLRHIWTDDGREIRVEEENVGQLATSATPQHDEQVNRDTPSDRNQSVDANMQQVGTTVPTEDGFDYTSPADLARHDLGLGRLDAADRKPVKGILKQPKARFFNEETPVREGVTTHKDEATKKDVPPGPRWIKINRNTISPEALTIGKERFEEQNDFVIVRRLLSKEEIQAYATATVQLRG